MSDPTSSAMTFDGVTVPVRPGQSVGAALMEAGFISWRNTRKNGKPRGLFCGIGVCFDCLVTVDGEPNQRACMTPALNGMQLISDGCSIPAMQAAEIKDVSELIKDHKEVAGDK